MTAFGLLALSSTRAHAQPQRASGVIDGIVSDTNLAPLASAEVAILNSAVRIVTGANGRFRILALPAGQFVLTVRKLGYQSLVREIDMESADTLRLSFLLEKSVRELDRTKDRD